MSQEAADFVVDNGTGAAVRADLNKILDSILTNNSGSSVPSYAKAYTLWADTANNVMKIRNAANDGFIELFQLDGTFTLEDGSASTPALSARNDLNTGVFFSAADKFNIATGGVERVEFGSTTIFNEDGADVDFRIEGDTEANLFYVDAGNDRIGIGTNSPDQTLHVHKGSAGSVTSFSNSVLTLENDTTAMLQFLTPSDANAQIRFGDPADNGAGFIQYNHTDNAIQFGTNGPEKMRITSSSDGQLIIGNTVEPTGGASGVFFNGNGFGVIGYAGSGSKNVFEFNNSNGNVGRINCNGSNTSYLTSSDYRLKENASAISDGITRIKSLKPYRFNFKTEPSVTQDGFFAHEVSSVVPIAVFGDKDATKEDGSIDPQGIDHSKLVPLLIAAVQELIGKVEALEAA